MVSGAGRVDLNGFYVPCSQDVFQERTSGTSAEHGVCWMLNGTTTPTTAESPIMLMWDSRDSDTSIYLPTSHDYVANGNIVGPWRITNGIIPAPTVEEVSCAYKGISFLVAFALCGRYSTTTLKKYN